MQQMNVLNSFTQQIGLDFRVQAVQRIALPYHTLHSWQGPTKVPFSNYRQGNVQTLNIYTVGPSPNSKQAFVSLSILQYTTFSVRSWLIDGHISSPPCHGNIIKCPRTMAS
jgi:hypothetical protein